MKILRTTRIAIIASLILGAGTASAQVSEIIDATGDGSGSTLMQPEGVVVDGAGNVYVTGAVSDNAFEIAARAPVLTMSECFLLLMAAALAVVGSRLISAR